MSSQVSSRLPHYSTATTGINALRQGWGIFLARFPWDWFCTLTLRPDIHPRQANSLLRRLLSTLQRGVPDAIGWFWVLERGRGRQAHFHALIAGVAHIRAREAARYWEHIAGHAVIRCYDPTRGAAFYCAKQISGNCGDDYDINVPTETAGAMDRYGIEERAAIQAYEGHPSTTESILPSRKRGSQPVKVSGE